MIPDKDLTDDVLDEIIAGAKTSMEQYLALSLKAEREVWRKEGPTDDERIMAIEGIHNCERCGDEGWVVGEMGITRCACGHPGNSPVIPDGYVMVPVEPNGDMLAAAQDAYGETDGDIASTLRAAMLAAAPQSPGSEPATVPGKWIPVSERMPDDNSDVLCTAEFDGPGDWRRKVGYWHEGKWVVYGASWTPTHWMPLPAGPQEVK